MQSAEQVSQLPLTPKCWEQIQIQFIIYLGPAYYARGATKVDAAMDQKNVFTVSNIFPAALTSSFAGRFCDKEHTPLVGKLQQPDQYFLQLFFLSVCKDPWTLVAM